MQQVLYRPLKYTAIVFVLAWFSWSLYDYLGRDTAAEGNDFLAAQRAFDDGDMVRAEKLYRAILLLEPEHLGALHGVAASLLQAAEYDSAIVLYGRLLAHYPEQALAYANRAVAYDRNGQHQQALADYEQAVRLEPSLAEEEPGLLTRFLRNQADAPPTIGQRLHYLRQQQALPPSQRLLQWPLADQVQRPYKP